MSLPQLITIQRLPIVLRIKFHLHIPQSPVWSAQSHRMVQVLCHLSAFPSASSRGCSFSGLHMAPSSSPRCLSSNITSSFRAFLDHLVWNALFQILKNRNAFLQYLANFLSVFPQLVTFICSSLIQCASLAFSRRSETLLLCSSLYLSVFSKVTSAQ